MIWNRRKNLECCSCTRHDGCEIDFRVLRRLISSVVRSRTQDSSSALARHLSLKRSREPAGGFPAASCLECFTKSKSSSLNVWAMPSPPRGVRRLLVASTFVACDRVACRVFRASDVSERCCSGGLGFELPLFSVRATGAPVSTAFGGGGADAGTSISSPSSHSSSSTSDSAAEPGGDAAALPSALLLAPSPVACATLDVGSVPTALRGKSEFPVLASGAKADAASSVLPLPGRGSGVLPERPGSQRGCRPRASSPRSLEGFAPAGPGDCVRRSS